MDFKKLTRLFLPIAIEGILSARRIKNDRLVEMIHDLEFVTRSAAQVGDDFIIKLQIIDCDLLHQLFAGEANRFLLASRVSQVRAAQNELSNASWQAVEHYYSAYYGVHYLLRLTGVSVTSLDERSIREILKSTLGANVATSIPRGLYLLDYEQQSSILTLTKNTSRSPGGSHQDAWRLWEELVDKLREQANTDTIEYASVAVDLAAHKRFLIRSTAKYNPPEIRGEINYQFKGGSWVFEPKSQSSIGKIQRSIASTHISSPERTAAMDGLISCNKAVIGLAKTIFLHAVDKYPKGICRSLKHKYSHYFE